MKTTVTQVHTCTYACTEIFIVICVMCIGCRITNDLFLFQSLQLLFTLHSEKIRLNGKNVPAVPTYSANKT